MVLCISRSGGLDRAFHGISLVCGLYRRLRKRLQCWVLLLIGKRIRRIFIHLAMYPSTVTSELLAVVRCQKYFFFFFFSSYTDLKLDLSTRSPRCIRLSPRCGDVLPCVRQIMPVYGKFE